MAVYDSNELYQRDVVRCRACNGKGFTEGEECHVCKGSPRIDFAAFTAVQIQNDDLRRTNLALHRENRVLRSCLESDSETQFMVGVGMGIKAADILNAPAAALESAA